MSEEPIFEESEFGRIKLAFTANIFALKNIAATQAFSGTTILLPR